MDTVAGREAGIFNELDLSENLDLQTMEKEYYFYFLEIVLPDLKSHTCDSNVSYTINLKNN